MASALPNGLSVPTIEPFQAHPRFKGFRVDTGELRAELIELGGIVTRIETPDREGRWANVLLGCPRIADYLGFHPHFNCLVGRYANRMTNAQFTLDGETRKLDANVPPHHLHGGREGFATRIWQGRIDGEAVVLELRSPDGDGGYPGALHVEARYGFENARVTLDIAATTDAPTPVSITSHHYYNLSGHIGSVAAHDIAIHADAFLPVSEALTQLGEIRPVDGTPFDLRRPTRLADAMAKPDAQMLLAGGGFDHTFVVAGDGARPAATVRHSATGRTLTVATDQPGMQLYTCNTLHEAGKHGRRYPKFGGLCLETQQFPDAPNHPNYPNAILRPGSTFRAHTEFAFSTC